MPLKKGDLLSGSHDDPIDLRIQVLDWGTVTDSIEELNSGFEGRSDYGFDLMPTEDGDGKRDAGRSAGTDVGVPAVSIMVIRVR